MEAQPLRLEMIMVKMRGKMHGHKRKRRRFFCGPLLTPDLRLSYFKKWCRDNNLE